VVEKPELENIDTINHANAKQEDDGKPMNVG